MATDNLHWNILIVNVIALISCHLIVFCADHNSGKYIIYHDMTLPSFQPCDQLCKLSIAFQEDVAISKIVKNFSLIHNIKHLSFIRQELEFVPVV